MIIAGVAFSVAAVGAAGQMTTLRPGPCAAQETYLLAGNSGALIRVEPQRAAQPDNRIIVFRQRALEGWASQRLLRRFDLRLDAAGTTIINSGAFCRGSQ